MLRRILLGALKSNTIQANTTVAAAPIVLKLLELISGTDFVSGNTEYAAIVAGLVAVVNIVLRFKTRKPLEER